MLLDFNVKRLNDLTDLAALLRSIDDGQTSKCGFDMGKDLMSAGHTRHPCGTACCIGGWVMMFNFSGKVGQINLEGAVKSLQPELDLDECCDLCYPCRYEAAWNASPEQAARAVEILRDTGVCDWKRAMKEDVT